MKNGKHRIYSFIARGQKVWNTWKHNVQWWQLLDSLLEEPLRRLDSCMRGFHVYQDHRRMDAGARWNTPLQTLHFVLSVALCTIPNYSVLIKFSSSFCLERCLVHNTELFTAHQILNFRKKNFRRVDIVTKITKFFYYENLELYGSMYMHRKFILLAA